VDKNGTYAKRIVPFLRPRTINSCSTNCICPKGTTRSCTVKHQIPGSISFVPSVASLIIVGEVVKDLIAAELQGERL